MEPSNPSVAVIVLATTVSFFAAPAASSYRHRSIDVDGVEAHYIEAGEGAPFILIHGGLAWSSGEANYAEVMAPLGEHFRVIAPDVIGFGRTTPRGALDHSGEAQGDFLIGFIEALDVGPVFLQGNSHGGFLAQYIAHKRPDLVRRLVITNSLNGTVPIPSLPEGKSYIYAPGGHQYASMTKDDVRTMLQSYYQHCALVTERRVELVFDNYQRNWEYAHARGTAVSSSVDALNRNLSYRGKHISERAKDLPMPVLLMWSEPGSKIEWGLSHFVAVPGAEMHLLPWSGHHLFTDQSSRWVQVVTDWLTQAPARPPGISEPEPRKTGGRRRFIDVDGVRTHYVEAGEGVPFVLVHGGGATSSGQANYYDVIAPLSEHFHVIAPDVVGFGYTAPGGAEHYTGEAQGDHLTRFIEALDVGPVFLNGNSHGGFLVQYVALKRPDLVRKLVITNSLNGTFRIPALPEGAPYIYAAAGHQYPERTIEETRASLEAFYQFDDLVTDERVQLVHDLYERNHAYAHERGLAVSSNVEDLNENLSYQGRHITEWAAELEMPLLLVWSERGSKIEWGLSHFFRVPGAEMHLIPWSGHHLMADQRDRWAQVVTNWLSSEPPRRPD